MACLINRTNNKLEVSAPNGKPSILHKSLTNLIKDNRIEPDSYVKLALKKGYIKDLSPEEHALALWSKVYTKSFKEWFGNSKVVDENGEPKMVIHVTNEDFDTFGSKYFDEKTRQDLGAGIFFSDSPLGHIKGSKTMPVFLNSGNVTGTLQEFDNDSVGQYKIANRDTTYLIGKDFGQEEDINVHVVFDPNQIKSIFNQGEFSTDPNIYKQKDVRQIIDELNEKFANSRGYILDEYVEHVRSKIKDLGGVGLRSTKEGYYIDNGLSPRETRETLEIVLNRLSSKFGIKWAYDTNMSAKGRFEGGVVYINPNKATLDTPFHEFAHPFLLALKKDNPSLYKRLVRSIKKEKGILERTKMLYPELTGDQLLEEAIVESIGREAATKMHQGLIKRFIQWIKDTVGKLFGQEVSSIREVATMLANDSYVKSLENIESEALYQIDEEDIDIYLAQLEGKTTVQKEVAERMIGINRQVQLGINEKGESVYVSADGQEFTRVSDELDTFPFYKFEKDINKENKESALQWGNDVDDIMRAVLLDKEVPTTSLPDGMSEEIYEEFKSIREKFPDAIILPQITFFNRKKKVAGTADIVVIHKTGEMEIVDVKTSRYDFKTKPNPRNKKKADSYDRHNAQLTMYRALAESMGFEFVEKGGLTVLPIQLEVVENEVVGFSRPYQFIQHGGVESLYETYKEGFEKSKFAGVMNNLKQVIQKKIDKSRKEGKTKQVQFLEEILQSIRTSIDIEGVNKFITEAYSSFLGNSTNFEGFYKKHKEYINRIQVEENPLELLSKIHEIEQSMELYKDSIMELWDSYLAFKEMTPLDDFSGDSTLEKLDKLQKVFTAMERDYKENIPKVLAKVLAAQVNPQTIQAIKANIKAKKSRKFVEQDTSKMGFLAKQRYAFRKNQHQKLIKQLNELEEKFLNDKGEIDMEKAIQLEISKGGYKDVSIMDRWLSPSASMPVAFLPTFVLTIKKAFEEVRHNNLNFIPTAYAHFHRFAKQTGLNIDNPHELNKGLYSKRTIYRDGKAKSIMVFTSPIDYGRFNQSKEVLRKEQEQLKTNAEKNKAKRMWEAENMQVRPKEHIEGLTKIGSLILIETVTDLENRKKKELGKNFDAWKESNIYNKELRGEYLIPRMDKFKDDNWNMSSQQQQYYKFLVSTYFESQSKQPKRREEDKFILPYIDKSSNDRLRQGELWKTLKYKTQDAFLLLEEDMLKENTEKTKTIPILYYNNALTMDADEVSVDLLHSVLRYKMAADRYEVQNKFIPLADNLLSLVEKTSPVETDSEGFKILDKAAKEVGITGGINKYVQKHGQNNAVAMLEAFIDTQLYGITRRDLKKKIGGVTLDVGKIADTIMNFASMTQIAIDPLTSLANSLNAQIQIAEEAFAGQFIDSKTWRAAQAYYNAHELELIQDSFNPYDKSFLNNLGNVYDAMQGEYIDEFGHKLTKSAFKAKMNTGLAFAGMHKGEHRAANVMLISLLMKEKRGDKTLFEIHQEEFEKTGKISLDINLQNRLHAINKRLHGVYNKFDAPELQRYAGGRLLLMYRKFLVPGLKRRFKGEGLDYELGDFTEGMYRTFYKKLFFETSELINAFQNKEGNLTPYELYNLRRAMFEHFAIATTGLLAWALMGLSGSFGDDDAKRYVYGAVLYEILRVNAELSVYGAIGDINNYFLPDISEAMTPYKSTSAAWGVLEKVTKVYAYAMGDIVSLIKGDDIARYKRASGVFEKGDSKTMAALMKLMGMSGKNINAEKALEVLAITKGIKIE